ncbi:MAG: Hint domain-containing protein [Rhodobacteraceae bacterium]|nr:Hint domain-containing protein [Paracoccaceae bacterium]
MPATFNNVYIVDEVPPGSGLFQVTGVVNEGTPVSYTDGDGVSGTGDGDDILESGEDVLGDGGTGATVVGQYAGVGNGDSIIVASGSNVAIITNSILTIGDAVTIVDAPLPVCFGAGTLIATPEGEKAVETLEIGDMILTDDGKTVPVKWLGRQTVMPIFAGERARPVRVSAGALGNGLPHTELVLTADHALIIDGLAINAGALVNGTTITQDAFDSLPERTTFYHVETEGHMVILANGSAAETYVDYVTRRSFDNYDEYVDLYGDERTIVEMDMPRVSSARLVPAAIRARLNRDVAA